MFNGQIYMASSLLARTAVGVSFFVLTARALTGEQYGFITYIFSYASLFALLSDFGLGNKMLRDIADAPEIGGQILNEVIAVKTSFIVLLLVALSVFGIFLNVTLEEKISALLLFVGVTAASYGDTALYSLRAVRKFALEFKVVLVTSGLYLALLVAAVTLNGKLFGISTAFAASRLIYMVWVLYSARQHFPRANFKFRPLHIIRCIRMSWSWGALSTLSYINGQIDGFLIVPILGLYKNGIYQAGSKFAASAVSFASIMTNIGIPKIAHSISAGNHPVMEELIIGAQTLMLGGCFSLGVLICGPYITAYLIGEKYNEVNSLWGGFAFLIMCRFLSCAVLTSLLARGLAGKNLIGEFATTMTSVPLLLLLMPSYGIICVPWIMSFSALCTASVLLYWRLRCNGVSKTQASTGDL